MTQTMETEIYRCDLCHRSVDADTRRRARQVWQPMIICERCIITNDTPQRREERLATTA